MIAAIGNSEYLARRIAPILQEFNGVTEPVLVGTDHIMHPHSKAQPGQIKLVQRAEVLAAENIDIIYISSATGHHFDDCCDALNAGKHVLIEKPICLRVEEVLELDKISRQRNLTVFECLSYRYHPVWAQFIDLINFTHWSSNTTISAIFRIPSRDITDFRWQPEHGGAAADLGTYCVDALLQLGAHAKDIHVVRIMGTDQLTDRGVAVAGQNPSGLYSGYVGLWAIGDEYANSIVVADTHRRIELSRAFTPPPGFKGTIVERRKNCSEPSVVVVTEPGTASKICLFEGVKRIRKAQLAGIVDKKAIMDRITILERIVVT
ncbi:Gfo/Idh/MocA family protein [Photorhabdus temperata]|uniref:Gfo/Idh/MocA-like oxidoreductase N-terminal domain-containing protein n=1 Tax=Photorhabdus temperata J3 TaxID=1389415 RepID=U7R0W1_PHOTE|nr:Gfo/Idh/MocA family oxidoreductase [Photorhabdus temperata]ERT13603.1 hypothetical protein O185_07955 [Photorhabdus temperata J3]